MKHFHSLSDSELLLHCDNIKGHSPIIDALASRLAASIEHEGEVSLGEGNSINHVCPICEAALTTRIGEESEIITEPRK